MHYLLLSTEFTACFSAELCVAGQKARRWAVERPHSWLNRSRHLLIRWAKKPDNYLAMLHFDCARITWYSCLFE